MELPGIGDVGSKVSIRLVNESPDEGRWRDLLGVLESLTTVRRKNGELLSFDPSQILLWKKISPPEHGTGLFLYNTQSREIEELMPSMGRRIHIYCCGPTVYRDAHVGNLRTFLLPDLISRILKFDGWHPVVVQNITDVGHMSENFEDKLLSESEKVKKDPLEIAREFEEKFFQSGFQISAY